MISRFLPVLALCLLIPACGPTAEQTGVMEFTIEGTTYRVEDVTLSVQANPRIYEGQQFKTIPRGVEHMFGYFLARPPTTETPTHLVDIQWFVQTADPDDGLAGQIRTAGAGGPAVMLTVLVALPHISFSNERRGDHTAWVAVDEIADGRARGRFGGEVHAVRPDAEGGVSTSVVEIEDGTFEVPFRTLFEFDDGD